MTPAFWDTSALVPLCVQQHPSSAVRELLGQHEIMVWWATSVEMRSAFERLMRTGQLTQSEHIAEERGLRNFGVDGENCSRRKRSGRRRKFF